MNDFKQAENDVPTIVIFVSGGLVQGIEGEGAVQAIVCDFDNDEGPDSVGRRPCTVGIWDTPLPSACRKRPPKWNRPIRTEYGARRSLRPPLLSPHCAAPARDRG